MRAESSPPHLPIREVASAEMGQPRRDRPAALPGGHGHDPPTYLFARPAVGNRTRLGSFRSAQMAAAWPCAPERPALQAFLRLPLTYRRHHGGRNWTRRPGIFAGPRIQVGDDARGVGLVARSRP